MSNNPTGPFKTREVMLADGKPIRVFEEIWVYQGGYYFPGIVSFIDISGKEAGDQPTVRAHLLDSISHTVNVKLAISPVKLQVGTGLRHIADPDPRGLRFARNNQEELDFLFAFGKAHGDTGGTGDPSQHPDPAKIPWEAWVPGAGKPGGTGAPPPATPPDVPAPTGDKPSGGEMTFHSADKDHSGGVSQREANKHEKKTGEKVDVTE